MRAIESSVSSKGMINEFNGWTNKFIFPPYNFNIANSMITNFHMPQSTLLMMIHHHLQLMMRTQQKKVHHLLFQRVVVLFQMTLVRKQVKYLPLQVMTNQQMVLLH